MIDLAEHVTAVTDAWAADDPEMTISDGILGNLVEILIRETGATIGADGTMDAEASAIVSEVLPDIDLLDINY